MAKTKHKSDFSQQLKNTLPRSLAALGAVTLAAASTQTGKPALTQTLTHDKTELHMAQNIKHTNHINLDTPQKAQVAALLKAIETGATEPVAVINSRQYRQHNLGIADGLAGFAQTLAQLPQGSAKVNTVRVFQDGNYVFAHTEYNFFGEKIGFDVFRFENGQIVEHWDNLQPTPLGPNPSGRSMTDGSVAITDLEQTNANKQLVAAFVDDVLVNGRMDKLAAYFEGDSYIQHNPQIADGLSGLGQALAAMQKAGISMQYNKLHKVLGEGNFVLTISEGTLGEAPTAFYDLFRLESGKIAEHWDTIEAIASPQQHKNSNGKFGFAN